MARTGHFCDEVNRDAVRNLLLSSTPSLGALPLWQRLAAPYAASLWAFERKIA
jgi:hypothetical protein